LTTLPTTIFGTVAAAAAAFSVGVTKTRDTRETGRRKKKEPPQTFRIHGVFVCKTDDMSTAVMSNPMFDCTEHLFKNAASTKAKEPPSSAALNSAGGGGNGHPPIRRSYTALMSSLIEQHRKLDRSVSEPTSRYKTELCRPFEESGACKYGDKCQFAHGYNELRNLARHPKYKTEPCRTYHSSGFCPYGPRCHFIHNFEEARIHNQKVAAQLTSTQQTNIMNLSSLNPLLSAAAVSMAAAAVGNSTGGGNTTAAATNNVSMRLLEQMSASPQAVVAAAAAATTANQNATVATPNLMRANSLSLGSSSAVVASNYNPPSLLRTSSLSLATNHHHHHQHHHGAHHHHQSTSNAVTSMIGATKPKPLNLSPTFSLGSTGDSVSPSSSLSQSPTNSMASFFSDECGQQPTTPFSFGQDFGLIPTRQSPSPRNSVCSPLGSDELAPRTPSPLSPNAESRLPVFNRISGTIVDFENLKI
jgi:tristetraprolin